MKRVAYAVWSGGLKEGRGMLSTESGALSSTPYSFATRFENGKGTNPEELIAAAHAGCFSMALSAQLVGAGLAPEKIETRAELTLDKTELGWTIVSVHLAVKARIPGADKEKFLALAHAAEKGCPVSRALNVQISMSADLEF